MSMKIILMGMPGSGKSTLGKRLASALSINFIDLDTVIEELEARSIPQIFKHDGEEYFRTAENNALKQVVKRPENLVLSTGGGTPCFFDNFQLMKEIGVTVYLHWPLPLLMTNLQQTNLETRPLFSGLSDEDLMRKLQGQHDKRHPFYEKAEIRIDINERSTIDLVLNELLQKLKPNTSSLNN